MNDINSAVKDCNIRLFADDTCLFLDVTDRNRAAQLMHDDLERISKWADQWLITFSPTKTKSLTISHKQDTDQNPRIKFNNVEIEEVKHHSYLGLILSYNLRWNEHIESISIRARKRLSMMFPLKYKLDRKTLQTMYQSFVKPVMEYCICVWGGTYDYNLEKLERIHCDGMRLITGAPARSNIRKLYLDTSLPSVREVCDIATSTMFYKIMNGVTPTYLSALVPAHGNSGYNLRNSNNIRNIATRLDSHVRSFFPRAIKLWNSLSIESRNVTSLHSFKEILRKNITERKVIYYYGERWPSVHHTRMRMGCSDLNFDLCYNRHLSNQPRCRCGAQMETVAHYFLECPLYSIHRNSLREVIEQISQFQIQIVLHGDDSLSLDQNKDIFDAVHRFITDSKRF